MPPYRMRIEVEAEEKGMARGLEKGLKQGLEQGLEQGLQQGLEEARRQGLIDTIAFGLKLKFGESGLQLTSDVQSIESLAVLEALRDALLTDASIDELRRLSTSDET